MTFYHAVMHSLAQMNILHCAAARFRLGWTMSAFASCFVHCQMKSELTGVTC